MSEYSFGKDDHYGNETVTIRLPFDVSAEDTRLLLAVKLYDGRVSLGKAAEMAGYSPEELDREVAMWRKK